ncbi:DUF6011 domain-containing protein [Amycolatopsis roodepoortensis]|uniref:Uncharacterized protein n=1 Tax=Amycolatopsis roodepoortensis TaxID=700274 RepID=A0ABR9L2P5_9PSEU|nr:MULTISPECIES: DUF6011 domain-containing protein [Amycolatopsis]MBE1575034.1 hypothetical protein [Amycolatopsis roodepoortensis]GHG97383.1 hypothetical protein GCM10017788_76850 [Amycolatopsis acidiphila]
MTSRCQRPQCGRRLTDPASQRRGYGPDCYRMTFGRSAPLDVAERVGPATLFDLPDAPPIDAPPPSRDARRTARQAEALRRGYHPLGVALRINIPLHPDAPRSIDRKAPGLRCGSCVLRVVPLRDVAGTYPKCSYGGDWRRATGGPGTDVRAWWPACKEYRPKGDNNK